MMDIEKVIASGDRVEFKRVIKEVPLRELMFIWIKACRSRVQDFAELADAEMRSRKQ